jgi:Xaa-Pro aminopeptidase
MIRVDPAELVTARQRRLLRVAETLGVDEWLLTTATAVRTATGAWSDEVDLFGEWAWPTVAVGSTVMSPGRPPNDPSLIDEVIDLLPATGVIAVDRMGQPALDRLAQLRPALKIEDARALLAGAAAPRDQEEIAVLVEAHRRTEAILATMIGLVQPGVSERELNAEFAGRAAEGGFDRLHVDTVFSVLPRERAQAQWARGPWADRAPYRELTTDRVLEAGDHVAFDAGIGYLGYTADVGWTLFAGEHGPSPAERSLAATWEQVARRVIEAARPGVSAWQVRQAALEGWDPDSPPPWPYPLYVAHGVGTELAEPPFVGTDMGPEAEAAMVIAEGNVLMIEPYIFEEGVGGYRSEYCVVVGANGTDVVSTLRYSEWPTY